MSTGYSHTPKLPRSLFYLTLGLAIRMDCFYPRTLYPDLELRLAPPGWAQTQVAPKPGLSQERHLNPAAIPPAQVEKKGQNLSGRPWLHYPNLFPLILQANQCPIPLSWSVSSLVTPVVRGRGKWCGGPPHFFWKEDRTNEKFFFIFGRNLLKMSLLVRIEKMSHLVRIHLFVILPL